MSGEVLTTEDFGSLRTKALRNLESQRKRRAAILNDPELAMARMRVWLASGEWWSRMKLMRHHDIKNGKYMTKIIDMMVATGEIEVGRWKAHRRGQGATGTYYRLKKVAENFTTAEPCGNIAAST